MRIAAVLLTCFGVLVVGHVMQPPLRHFMVFGGDGSNTGWLYAPQHQSRWGDRPDTKAEFDKKMSGAYDFLYFGDPPGAGSFKWGKP